METLLHVGCGGAPAPPWLADYKEVRLDIDSRHNPDIVASMTDLGDIGPFDVILCEHSLEHCFPQDVPKVLSEFYRILKIQGRAIIVVPDLEGVMPTDEVLFTAPAGPITGMDMIYGYGKEVKEHPAMQHHCGFVQWTLEKALSRAGFNAIARRLPERNLLAVAVKP